MPIKIELSQITAVAAVASDDRALIAIGSSGNSRLAPMSVIGSSGNFSTRIYCEEDGNYYQSSVIIQDGIPILIPTLS